MKSLKGITGRRNSEAATAQVGRPAATETRKEVLSRSQ